MVEVLFKPFGNPLAVWGCMPPSNFPPLPYISLLTLEALHFCCCFRYKTSSTESGSEMTMLPRIFLKNEISILTTVAVLLKLQFLNTGRRKGYLVDFVFLKNAFK